MVTRHVPRRVWAVGDGNACLSWLQTGEVVAVRARTITAICFLRFIFSPLVDSIFPFVVLALFGFPRWEVIFGRSLKYCVKFLNPLRGKFGNFLSNPPPPRLRACQVERIAVEAAVSAAL